MSDQQSQPEVAPVRQNGEFYVSDGIVRRAPVHTKTATGTNISIGFPVCEPSEYTDADNLAACLNEHVSLQARVEEQQKICDSYAEENQRFHDRIEELTKALEHLAEPFATDPASGMFGGYQQIIAEFSRRIDFAKGTLALPLERSGGAT